LLGLFALQFALPGQNARYELCGINAPLLVDDGVRYRDDSGESSLQLGAEPVSGGERGWRCVADFRLVPVYPHEDLEGKVQRRQRARPPSPACRPEDYRK
jgi:hypothetical protein